MDVRIDWHSWSEDCECLRFLLEFSSFVAFHRWFVSHSEGPCPEEQCVDVLVADPAAWLALLLLHVQSPSFTVRHRLLVSGELCQDELLGSQVLDGLFLLLVGVQEGILPFLFVDTYSRCISYLEAFKTCWQIRSLR